MKKTRALLEHPIIAQHVPETVWYNSNNLIKMVAQHSVIYIKPDTGCQGNRVMRLKKVNETDGLLAFEDYTKNISLADAPSVLNSIISKRKFIIQQGIDLATYRNCPFDIRIVMQRPYRTWEITLTSAKVASREQAVVTNVSKGAQDYPLIDILQQYDQKQNPTATIKQLVNLSHQICHLLGIKYPLRIIGLDMAVDKHGRIWFIEANTQPQCARCKLVNDKISQHKYEKARTIIKGKTKNHR